jgi:hypothetical protein
MTVAHYIETNPGLRGMGADAGLALSTGDWPFGPIKMAAENVFKLTVMENP